MSTFQLLKETFAEGVDFAILLARLARVEARQQIAKASRGSALGLAAVVGLVFAVLFLLLGVVELIIAYGVATYLAFLIVGGALALVSLLLGLLARATLKGVTLRPDLALDQIRRLSAAEGRGHQDEHN
jgi:Putative Actinobacterial Holin-X, holin superfamily III